MPIPPKPISTDLPCCRCSYNLRGLTSASRCPECGTPVQTSIYAIPKLDRPLADADPGYVRALSRSAALMLGALAVAAFTPAVKLFLPPANVRPYDRSAVVFGGDLLARALICWSVFLLTRREPGGAESERTSAVAVVLRAACVGSLLGPPIVRVAGSSAEDGMWLPAGMAALLTFLASGPYFWFVGTVAGRLPTGRRLSNQAGLLFVAAPLAVLFSFCVRPQSEFADFPLLAFGFPADDLAHVYGNPFHPGNPIGLWLAAAPAVVTAWSAATLLGLWRALRELTRSRVPTTGAADRP